MENKDPFVEFTLPDVYDFGSFNRVLVHILSDEILFPHNGRGRKRLTIQHQTLPEANGYWNIRGREHKVFYKKKHVATVLTEDCGMGSQKVRAFFIERGFKL